MLTLFAILVATSAPDFASVHPDDQWRFPHTLDVAKRNWDMASTHVAWLETHAAWECDWLSDARHRRRCWDLLDDCRRIHPLDRDACGRKLAELRLLIGENAYWRGVMPDPLPSQRFRDR